MRTSIAAKIMTLAACLGGGVVAAPSGAGTPANLAWTGEISIGSGITTLVGTDIYDILDQIHAVAPDYDAAPNDRSVAADKAVIQNIQCGVFATADKRNFMQIQYDLRKAGGNCTVPARSCLRLSCLNTSGIYVCNDNYDDVTQPCVTFADFASAVGGQCCRSSYTTSKALSGQAFSDERWNVGVAYANCKHANNADAPSIFGLPGLNGECRD